ncbi:hypothetical protein V8C86DRAFT_1802515, partial [Haematococcus lacustris]
EERAVRLGGNPAERAALRERLMARRATCPLFNTQRWVRDFETALCHMWACHCAGKPPHSFRVAELSPDNL